MAAEMKWPIDGAYLTKKEIISELIWIQEFLDELSEFGLPEDYQAQEDKLMLANKYSLSIDRIYESVDELLED